MSYEVTVHLMVSDKQFRETPEVGSTYPYELSVIIKTLNEERYIAKSIESALAALRAYRGEVIVSDSASSDRTLEIARTYPVRIVQLRRPEERRCGVGPQMGYQHARSAFLYILDGDMELKPGFLEAAMAIMKSRSRMAGVAGIVEEFGGDNYEFETRKRKNPMWARTGEQPWLEMGGLYRCEAIESVGYFSNRNLHAYEEQELGLRLRSRGWELLRIDTPSVRHHGHRSSTLALMRQRWSSRYIDGAGELLRATFGQEYFWEAIRGHRNLIAMSVVWSALPVSIAMLPWHGWPFAVVVLVLIQMLIVMAVRKRSLRQGFVGFVLWPIRVMGFLRGLLTAQRNPYTHIDTLVVQEQTVQPRLDSQTSP